MDRLKGEITSCQSLYEIVIIGMNLRRTRNNSRMVVIGKNWVEVGQVVVAVVS